MIHVWRAKNYRWTLTVLENARVPEPLGVLPTSRPADSLVQVVDSTPGRSYGG